MNNNPGYPTAGALYGLEMSPQPKLYDLEKQFQQKAVIGWTAASTKHFEISTFATARLTGTMVTLADLEELISGVVIAREAWRKLHTFVTAVKAMACSFSSQNQQHRVKVHRKLEFAGKIERMHSLWLARPIEKTGVAIAPRTMAAAPVASVPRTTRFWVQGRGR